jgi:hypothetical protein
MSRKKSFSEGRFLKPLNATISLLENLLSMLETVKSEDMLVPNGQTRNASADSLIRFNRVTVC